jgi:uncharacterized protein (TIGR00725 family)
VAPRPAVIAVVGPGEGASAFELAEAESAGAAIGAAGCTLLCGGLGGVMEAACRGARSEGGFTVGLLPGVDAEDANGWVVLSLPTGLGEARNAVIARSADAVVAIGGGWGTLSELAFALRAGTPVVGVGTWELRRGGAPVAGVRAMPDGRSAVAEALQQLR